MLNNQQPQSKQILIVGPSWVGDMVMAQSLFKLLKQQNKDVQIDVLAPQWSAPILERMPEVRASITMPLGHGQFDLKARYQLGKQLRAKHYDQAIVLPNSWKSALVPYFAKIPVRTGWRGEMRWGLLNDVRYLDKQQYPLMIERFMALGVAEKAQLPEIYPHPKFQIQAQQLEQTLQDFSLPKSTKPVLALCPGAEYGPAKRWPAKYFSDLAKQRLQAGWDIWIFGSAKDQTIAAEIQAGIENNAVDFTGKTSLAQAIDLLSSVTQVVTNDSGLMHITAALDKPMVAIYGSSTTTFTPPLSDKASIATLNLSCSPCFKRECPLGHLKCLNDLTVNKVLTQLNELPVT